MPAEAAWPLKTGGIAAANARMASTAAPVADSTIRPATAITSAPSSISASAWPSSYVVTKLSSDSLVIAWVTGWPSTSERVKQSSTAVEIVHTRADIDASRSIR
ncbi:hypothetical protein [Fodinicola feengrottensis]|uniref:hypothetical protein n=1 Tax=Fodinicola feengrottensis TaxID=435914 RepID=UPI00244346FE|nr:hypothetical protein [Fodinicola feengrottensis]